MLQPFLCRSYPTSSVLYCNPTPYLSSGFLALLSLVHHTHSILCKNR